MSSSECPSTPLLLSTPVSETLPSSYPPSPASPHSSSTSIHSYNHPSSVQVSSIPALSIESCSPHVPHIVKHCGPLPVNTHSMVTRFKDGIFQPKLFLPHQPIDSEPVHFRDALSN